MALLPPDPVFCLKSDMGHVHNLCFLATEVATTSLLAATEEGFLYNWDLELNRVRSKQKIGKSLQAIHCTTDNLISQEKSGAVKLWNMKNEMDYELSREFNCNGGYCRSIVIDNFLILPQSNSKLDAIDVKTLEQVCTFTPLQENLGYVTCLQKVELSGNIYLLAGYESGDLILWELQSTKQCGHAHLKEYITSITFDSLTGRGVCGNSSNTLQVFSINKDFNIALKCELSITNDGCGIVKLRPDRKILVSGGWDSKLRLYSWKSLRLLAVLNQHHKSVTDVQFSPKIVPLWNSNIMAAAGSDGIISLWNLYN